MEDLNKFLVYDTKDIDEPALLPNKMQINESSENRTICLQILRENLKNLKDIDHCTDEIFLLFFLRVSKFNTSQALKRIQSYYQQLDVLTDAFKKCSIPLERAQNTNYLKISPYRPPDNSFLLISLQSKIDYRKMSFADRFYLDIIALNQVVIRNPVNQICGATVIIDLEGFSVHGLLACSPKMMWVFVNSITSSLACRLKGIHIVNAPSFFPSIYKMAKPIIPEKIQKRVFVHPSNDGWRSLHTSIPPEILPELYGGQLKEDMLINCLNNIPDLVEKLHKTMAFGYSKTKHKRQALKVIY